jgi:hypothetical protein
MYYKNPTPTLPEGGSFLRIPSLSGRVRVGFSSKSRFSTKFYFARYQEL